MALSDFFIGINFGIQQSRQSRAAIQKTKLDIDSMHDSLQRFNDFANKGFVSMTDGIEGFNDNIKNVSSVIDRMSEWRFDIDDGGKINAISDSMNKLNEEIERVNSLAEGFAEASSMIEPLTPPDFIQSMEDFKNSLFQQEQQIFGVEKASGSAKEALLDMSKAMTQQRFEQTFVSANSALESMRRTLKLNDETIQAMGENAVQAFAKMQQSLDPESFEDVSEAINNVSFENLDPTQIQVAVQLMTELRQEINKGSDANVESINAITQAMKKLQEGTGETVSDMDILKDTISSMWSGTKGTWLRAVGLYALLDDAAEAQTNLTRDIVRMNINAQDSMTGLVAAQQQYTSAMLAAGAATGSSLQAAQEQMNALASLRVSDQTDQLGRLAETGLDIQHALGLSVDQSADFIKNLKLIGGLNETQIRGAANAMANVQESMGLTSQEAAEVASQVGVIMNQMQALGGSADQVEIVTEEVAKMTAAFTKAGMSAQDASQLLNSMMDPQKLSENTLLFRQMGLSANEALQMMSGEGQNMEGMTEKLVETAKGLKEQYGGNIYALQAMADAHGMSLSQVQKLSQLNAEDLKTTREKQKLEEQASEARAGLNDALARIGGTFNILMASAFLPLLNLFADLLHYVARFVEGFSTLGGLLDKQGIVGSGFRFLVGSALTLGFIFSKRLIPASFRFVKNLLMGNKTIAKMASGLKDFGGNFAKKGADVSKSLGGAGSAANKGAAGMRNFGRSLKAIPIGQILAIGAAIAFIAVGIAAIVFSLAQLADAVQDMSLVQMITFMAGSLLLVVGIIWAMIPAIGALGAVSAAAWGPILAVGGALLFMAAGVALIVYSLSLLVEKITGLISAGGNAANILAQISGLIITITASITGMMVALVGLSATAPLVLGAAASFALLGVTLMALGVATNNVSENILNLGTGMQMIADNAQGVKSSIQSVKESLSGFEVPAGFNQLASALMTLGQFADRFSQSISALGLGIFQLGQGLKLIADNVNAAIEPLNQLLNMLAAADMKALENINATLKTEAEVKEGAPNEIGATAPAAMIEPRVEPNVNVSAETPAGRNEDTISGKFDIANDHLDKIEGYLENIWNKFKDNTGGGNRGPLGSSTSIEVT